jgi:hypothetical protein
MMNGMMTSYGMMFGMGLLGLLVIIMLVLAIVALGSTSSLTGGRYSQESGVRELLAVWLTRDENRIRSACANVKSNGPT